MKQYLYYFVLLFGISLGLKMYHDHFFTPPSSREIWSQYLQKHPFNNRERAAKSQEKKNKTDRPDLAWEQDYLRTMDPALGRPAPERLVQTMAQMSNNSGMYFAPGASTTPWIERGPMNVGGRTRALVWDPNDLNGTKVWAGGVTGGLWYNSDITNGNSNWISVNDFWDNISITCIAYDPNNTQIMYVGTGEGWGGSATPTRGAGIWKSTNGGGSWTQLASTTGYYYVNDIVVRNESGTSVVYAAVDGTFYQGVFHGSNAAGLRRSNNGGTSWTQVLPLIPGQAVNFVASDIEIGANNRIWIGTRRTPFASTDRGGGRILFSDNGTTWTISDSTIVTNGLGRVELACAPSNANVVYAMIENNSTVTAMKKTTNGGTNWTAIAEPADADTGIPAGDFSRGQAWYDMILAVDPADATKVIAGAIDLFRSTNSGTSWSQISKWSNNNNLANLTCSYVHADQHAIVYKPGSTSTLLIGNDGGVFYTSKIDSAATKNVFSDRNRNYNVTQFYACAMHPSANAHQYLAGSQDNGTQRFTQSGMNITTEATGGDGAYCFIDQTTPAFQVTSYVYNNYYRSSNTGATFSSTLLSDNNTGKFINPADYDDNQHVLYSTKNSTSIYRVRNITTTPAAAETVTITGLADNVSHIRVSPYTTGSTTLFLGTDAGSIFKVTSANGTPVSTDIDVSGTLPTGTISCIEIGASENELLVTFFNYGIASVWYTSNGGTNWVSKEGNLPDMPVRWSLFNPNNRNEVILATELGVWTTTGLNNASPSWSASNSGLANVRVDMLQIRSSDLQVVAATHGRGLFTSDAFGAATAPNVGFQADKRNVCLNEIVSLKDTSLFYPTSWTWSVTPNTFTFSGGTTASSRDPKIQFTAAGTYTISLTASNGSGTNNVSRVAYIKAGGDTLPFVENWESTATSDRWLIENPDFLTTWKIKSIGGNGSSTKAMSIDNFNYSEAKDKTERDGLISPPISLVGKSSATLTFKYAFRRYSATIEDSLAVFVSTNCGTNWIRVASYRETNSVSPFVHITNTNTTSNFTPSTSADWCGNANFGACKTIDLTAFAGNTIKIKFENISSFGNNFYIDEVGVTGVNAQLLPVAKFGATNTNPCQGNAIIFIDSSQVNPTGWQWTFTPSTVTFLDTTSAFSQHPKVSFNAAGTYTVKLKATNNNGSDSLTRTNYISVTASVTPTISITANDTNICAGDSVHFSSSISGGGSTPRYRWKINNSIVDTNANFSSKTLNNGDTITCLLISKVTCATKDSVVSKKISMVVHAKPTVTFTLPNRQFCLTDTTLTLTGASPSGGIFLGTGVSSGTFKPQVSGSGTFLINYTFTDGFGCSASAKDSITVNPLPNVTFALPTDNFCHTDTTFNLTGGLPNGGIYAGNGVTNNQFNTLAAGVGSFAISYTFTDNKGCSKTAKDSIFVNSIPTAALTLTTNTLCIKDTTINLGGGSPAGGIYTGTGVSNNQFKPLVSGSGKFAITYTVTNAKGCKNKAIDSLLVNALPVVTFVLSKDNLCQSDTGILLTGGTPSGGIYSGTGISGNQFKPQISGSGDFMLGYKFTDAKGCSKQVNDTMHVNPLPTVSLVLNPDDYCISDTLVSLSGGSPSGGVYSGFTVSGNLFRPKTAGTGKFAVTYSVTSAKGCSNKATDSLQVHALPTVSLNLPFAEMCEQDSAFLLTGGLPSGGIYSGAGIIGSMFNSKSAGPGKHPYLYTFTDVNGCSNKAGDSILIHPSPLKPSITRSADTLTCTTTALSYQWYRNTANISGAIAKTLIVAQEGQYQVRTANEFACLALSDSFAYQMSDLESMQASHIGLQVYPNPSKGVFMVDLTLREAEQMRMVVTDIAGKIVYDVQHTMSAGHTQTRLPLSGLASGSYLLTIYDGDAAVKKIILIE
ncbi:MAG: T9SS type A sorting domain-containing protein [Bacteroidia bacterium]|jgi:PKD repeat protein